MFLRQFGGVARQFGSAAKVPIRLQFYTKDNCMLCYEAKQVLEKAVKGTETPVSVEYIDIERPENGLAFEKYRYDIPVIHVQREGYKDVVYMHRLDLDELLEEFNEDV